MPDIPPRDVPLLLRVVRAIHDWSQVDLANRAGLAEVSIRRYERGESVPPEATLAKIVEVSRIKPYFLYGSLLSTVRVARRLAYPDRSGALDLDPFQRGADELAEEMAALARSQFLDLAATVMQLESENLAAAGANAWRPLEAQREGAESLWKHLKDSEPQDRAFILAHGAAFRSWALVERVAHDAETENDPVRALEWTALALKIANEVQGEDGWPERVKGYALAALARAQRAAGRSEEAERTARQALECWEKGKGFPGLLDEGRFRVWVEGEFDTA